MKSNKLCASKIQRSGRHRINTPIPKERNRKEKGDRSHESPRLSGANIKSEGLRIISFSWMLCHQACWGRDPTFWIYWGIPTPMALLGEAHLAALTDLSFMYMALLRWSHTPQSLLLWCGDLGEPFPHALLGILLAGIFYSDLATTTLAFYLHHVSAAPGSSIL